MTIDEINKNLLRSADGLFKNLGYKTLDEIIVETEERIRRGYQGWEGNSKMNNWEILKNYIKSLEEYYKNGVMCSWGESVHGAEVCREILNKIKAIEEEETK